MRLRTTLLSTAVLMPLTSMSLALGPGDPCTQVGTVGDDPVLACTQATYLLCEEGDQHKVHLDTVHGAVALGPDAPARSVQAGAGCGRSATPVADPGQLPAEEVLRVAGTYTGNVDTVAVELHILGPGVGQAGQSISVPLTLTVGDEILAEGIQEATVVPSSTNASVALRFVFDATTLAGETGEGTTERAVELVAGYPNLGACQTAPIGSGCAPAGAYPYVWGTTEVPAGITFNPAS